MNHLYGLSSPPPVLLPFFSSSLEVSGRADRDVLHQAFQAVQGRVLSSASSLPPVHLSSNQIRNVCLGCISSSISSSAESTLNHFFIKRTARPEKTFSFFSFLIAHSVGTRSLCLLLLDSFFVFFSLSPSVNFPTATPPRNSAARLISFVNRVDSHRWESDGAALWRRLPQAEGGEKKVEGKRRKLSASP